MTANAPFSREINGKGRTVRELLAGRKYSIGHHQRECKWQRKQPAEWIWGPHPLMQEAVS